MREDLPFPLSDLEESSGSHFGGRIFRHRFPKSWTSGKTRPSSVGQITSEVGPTKQHRVRSAASLWWLSRGKFVSREKVC